MTEHADLPLFRWGNEVRTIDAARARRRRLRLGWLIAGASALTASPLVLRPVPRLLWNASASVPEGLYRVAPGSGPRMGELAVVSLPAAVRRLAARRRYLPSNVPLLKPVAAVGGARVCATGRFILIADRIVAERRRRDAAGRPLPWWNGCRTLTDNEIFLLGTHRPDSFDGRYFGPLPRAAVIGTARPLWVR